jgi:hypothetical protein
MPLIDHIPPPEPDADYLKIAMLKRGEVISLVRPNGEGWVSARRRFDAIGARLGFTLRLWWSRPGERWYVVRDR